MGLKLDVLCDKCGKCICAEVSKSKIQGLEILSAREVAKRLGWQYDEVRGRDTCKDCHETATKRLPNSYWETR